MACFGARAVVSRRGCSQHEDVLSPPDALPDVPRDFGKQCHSVWLDPPNYLFDPEKGHQLYNDFLRELELAEEMGFDGLCVNEHHGSGYGLMPSPILMASAMARSTSRAAVIVLGNSLTL